MKNQIINYKLIDDFILAAVLVFVGLFLPMFLVLIIRATGFSEVVEEIFKALVVTYVILKFSGFSKKIKAGILFGFLFAISESLLYFNNFFQNGSFSDLWSRFFLTLPMHIITVLVILFFGLKSKKYIVLGTILAIVIHLIFNKVV